MNGTKRSRLDFSWRSGNRAALAAAGLTAAAMLSLGTLARPVALSPHAPVDLSRVQSVRERIDPNVASAASLRRLPGIGPTRAEAIVLHRSAPGARPFAVVEDLRAVSGIGPVTARRIAPYLSLPTAVEIPRPNAGDPLE